jgi:hypothetical protein
MVDFYAWMHSADGISPAHSVKNGAGKQIGNPQIVK